MKNGLEESYKRNFNLVHSILFFLVIIFYNKYVCILIWSGRYMGILLFYHVVELKLFFPYEIFKEKNTKGLMISKEVYLKHSKDGITSWHG